MFRGSRPQGPCILYTAAVLAKEMHKGGQTSHDLRKKMFFVAFNKEMYLGMVNPFYRQGPLVPLNKKFSPWTDEKIVHPGHFLFLKQL